MYQGANMDVLVYDQSVAVTAIKQNLFVHDFNLPPVGHQQNEVPAYIRREVVETDTTTWVKFYNFLYETAGVPTTLKLQYQYISHRTRGGGVNIGARVALGEIDGLAAGSSAQASE
ncbi:MAG: hypothetical protein U5L72_16305 [Bacteroidales bacterium]|nr:hypothetical protein [Bacteroidales bacterium]